MGKTRKRVRAAEEDEEEEAAAATFAAEFS